MNTCEDYQPLLVGLIDGELTAEEASNLNTHLQRCAACRQSHDELRETDDLLANIRFEEVGDADLRALWRSPYSRGAYLSAIWLMVGGYVLLMGYGIVQFLISEEPFIPRFALGAMVIGFVALLAMVIRERLITYKHDPYKEVER